MKADVTDEGLQAMATQDELRRFDKIKRLAITAMFSDDDLMELLVLKGGNALDIVYRIAPRASIDLDFSMPGEFQKDSLPAIRDKLRTLLVATFAEAGYHVFDFKFTERPQHVSPRVAHFWGGYAIEFKIIKQEEHARLAGDVASLRRNATVVAPRQHRTFEIEISKFEYCAKKVESELEGYTVYVYAPEMLVAEKLRAICQQMPDYGDIVPNPTRRARARDFFDIHTVMEHFGIDLTTAKNRDLIRDVFAAKRVPLRLLGEMHKYREFHRHDFIAVENTLKPGEHIQGFDFYFDYVLERCEGLQSLWEE